MTSIIGATILCMIFLLDLTNANSNSSSRKEDLYVANMRRKAIIVQEELQSHHRHHKSHNTGVTTDFKSWNFRRAHERHHRRLRVVHGVVNIFGWGILLPIGVIIARYYKRPPLKCDEWYPLHVRSKVAGFILGSVGWGIGISIRNSAKEHTMMSTHGILGTIIFTFTTIQVLAICLLPDEENVYRKYWVIYHNCFGYALIILTIVNIFQGIEKEAPSNRWKWSYAVLVGVMGLTALFLELIPCFTLIKYKLSSNGIE
ncbi:cytochrome b561 and DOMON domain-containing protein At5g35735-like isoform X1 [Lycium barbarum]|uniref:cytochrome b561 and DOMON domain-containing protein At5g35735-like isoform X1 n=1 Tax=Lycium barbarum TaxID=112863 RepID=UPI00293F3191|nr:cytochrome b561 and DOMON domain-containing protein At5g35735-like isoform X1 [Lycium barbarum]